MAQQDAEELALRCCVCGTSAEDDSNYLNTKMKMLISKCGHRLYVLRRLRRERESASRVTSRTDPRLSVAVALDTCVVY